MNAEQELKRDLLKEFFCSNFDGPWLGHLKNMLQPIMYPPGGAPHVPIERAIEILYDKVERNDFS